MFQINNQQRMPLGIKMLKIFKASKTSQTSKIFQTSQTSQTSLTSKTFYQQISQKLTLTLTKELIHKFKIFGETKISLMIYLAPQIYSQRVDFFSQDSRDSSMFGEFTQLVGDFSPIQQTILLTVAHLTTITH